MYLHVCSGEGDSLEAAIAQAEHALAVWRDGMNRDKRGTPLDYEILAYATALSQAYHPEQRAMHYSFVISVTYTIS